MGLINNVKWVTLSQFVRVLCQLVGMVFFSRYLTPREIGIMSMAVIIVNFINIIRDMGSSAAIIQKDIVSEELKRSVFSLNLLIGCFLFFAVYATSGLISSFFGEKELEGVICLIAFAFPITSSTSIHLSLLERDSLFFKTAKIEVISSISSLCLGLLSAIYEFGVYSLVIQTLSYAIFSSIGFWFSSNWKAKVGWSSCEIRSIFRFSSNLVGFNFINYFSRNLDQIIIGKLFGASILGLYSLAYKVMLFPLQNITSILTRSLYPILSRLQNEKNEGWRIYLNTLRFISYVIPPLMLGLAAIRNDFVLVVFGEKWLQMSSLLLWLAPTAILQSLISTTGSVFMSSGRTDLLLKISIFNAILQMVAFIIGGFFNIDMLVKLYFIANAIMFFPNLGLAASMFNQKIISIVVAVYKPIFFSIIMYLLVVVCGYTLISYDVDPFLRVVISVLCGLISYGFLAYVFDRAFLKAKFSELRK